MNVIKKNIDDLTLQLTLQLAKEDYADKKKKILSDFRRKAEIKGFRKGMAPMSLIEKMHGPAALGEAVNNALSEGLTNYIQENKINIIGEPLPNDEAQKPIDWENDETFEFVFDIALAPVIDLKLSKDDKIVSYTAKVSDQSRNEYRSNLLKQYGKLELCDAVKEEDFIIADFEQEGMKVEGTYVTLRAMSEDAKKLFLGKKAGDSFEINVNEAFVNESDRASMLRVKKEELASMNPVFKVTIKEVKNFVEAEANQETFDKIFGEGVVKSEEEFMAKIDERLLEEYKQETEFRFILDARDYLIEKTGIKLPEDFLKRWIFTMNEGKFSMEEIEKDFPLFLKDFRWQLIRQYLMKENNISVSKEDMTSQAKKIAAYQFAMYGISNMPEEQISKYAESMLQQEKEARRIYEKVEDDKTLAFVRESVTIEPKEIEIEELRKLTA